MIAKELAVIAVAFLGGHALASTDDCTGDECPAAFAGTGSLVPGVCAPQSNNVSVSSMLPGKKDEQGAPCDCCEFTLSGGFDCTNCSEPCVFSVHVDAGCGGTAIDAGGRAWSKPAASWLVSATCGQNLSAHYYAGGYHYDVTLCCKQTPSAPCVPPQ